MISLPAIIITFLVMAVILFLLIKLIQKSAKKLEETKYQKEKDPLKQLKTY